MSIAPLKNVFKTGLPRRFVYPEGFPGIDPPGPDVLAHMAAHYDWDPKAGPPDPVALREIYRDLLYKPGTTMPVTMKGIVKQPAVFIPGHKWGKRDTNNLRRRSWDLRRSVDGPRPSKVLVIGKMPWKDEAQALRNYVGETGSILVELLEEGRWDDYHEWYMTNLVRFMPPNESNSLATGWIKTCKPLMQQEIAIVQPDYILCLGTDSSVALLGKDAKVTQMEGRVREYPYSYLDDPDGDLKTKTALVMTVMHPVNISRDKANRRVLEHGLAKFKMLTSGHRFDREEKDVDHRFIETIEDLEAAVHEAELECEDRLVAVDAEWHGDHPQNKSIKGSGLRMFQFSVKPKQAFVVELRNKRGRVHIKDAEGRPAFKRAIKILKRFFKKKRVAGHFFIADLEWLVAEGLDLRKQFAVPLYDAPDGTPAWMRTRNEGGFDTGLAAHAIEETAKYGLDSLTLRYTDAPAYWQELDDWLNAEAKRLGIPREAIEGYGSVPRLKLLKYAAYDVDVTMRILRKLQVLLDCDYERNCCRESFWEKMIACPAALEMHRTGVMLDRERAENLTKDFLLARDQQEVSIKAMANWPDQPKPPKKVRAKKGEPPPPPPPKTYPSFNLRSVQHVREYLFGYKLNGKKDKEGNPVRIRPPGAKCLKLTPIIDTSKPPKRWNDVVLAGKKYEASPSTNKTVLAIMAQDNMEVADEINAIRNHRFLDQVTKTVLRPPDKDKAGEYIWDPDEEEFVYSKGLIGAMCDDLRVRTHFYLVRETGRWSSARPNLQAISKQRDSDLEKIFSKLGLSYENKIRSVFRAAPGHVLIEADYKGAELYVAAIMAGDTKMIEDCQRNQLLESDPNYYDIHSNIAVTSFRLDCAPTKQGLKDIGRVSLRTVAKTVIFGLMYGRGAKAIALTCKEQGVDITVDDAQVVIDSVFEMYPRLQPFFRACQERVEDPGWLCNCFGAFRRFPKARDEAMLGEFQRQAMNFPIQSAVASAMNRALSQLLAFRVRSGHEDMFKCVLQIHDAVVLEVPERWADHVSQEVLPYCMSKLVSIRRTRLDGMPIKGAKPYHLGVDVERFHWWGEKIKAEA